ncbi:MAG: hydrogenase iron-sulfur subunit [Methanomassiliicoccales archaeon]|nr:hydrogenase iron-sulfur subunit [Methanomassiliicoccales archaeon]
MNQQPGCAPEPTWRPRIVAFCCNWCAYAGADLAGVSRRQYSSEVKILRVMCSSRVSAGIILKSFASGADGVMVLGCHPGDCHYQVGNLYTEKRVEQVRELLLLVGIDDSRLRLEWISAAEGEKFGRTIDDFVKTVRALGPLEASDEGE